MELLDIITYSAMLLTVLAALNVICSKHAVYSALSLILCFVASAAIWLILEAEFLAITLVLVYVGAVMVLFLFVVMMLDIEKPIIDRKYISNFLLGLVVCFLLAGTLPKKLWSIYNTSNAPLISENNNIKVLGLRLYTEYILPFELAGIILLVAIVAAIGLSFKAKKGGKKQNPHLQVQVTKASRLKIIKDKE